MSPSVDELVVASVGRMQDEAGLAAMPEGIQDLIDQLIVALGNVDADEATAILAKVEEAVTAFAAGKWLVGMLALVAAFRLYRAAIED